MTTRTMHFGNINGHTRERTFFVFLRTREGEWWTTHDLAVKGFNSPPTYASSISRQMPPGWELEKRRTKGQKQFEYRVVKARLVTAG